MCICVDLGLRLCGFRFTFVFFGLRLYGFRFMVVWISVYDCVKAMLLLYACVFGVLHYCLFFSVPLNTTG